MLNIQFSIINTIVMNCKFFFPFFILSSVSSFCLAQLKGNDVTTPLHALKPNYPVPYNIPVKEEVKQVLDKVYHYLDSVTPYQFVNRVTNAAINDLNRIDTNTMIKAGDFRLAS